MHTEGDMGMQHTGLPLRQISSVTAGCSSAELARHSARMLSLGYRYGTNHEWR